MHISYLLLGAHIVTSVERLRNYLMNYYVCEIGQREFNDLAGDRFGSSSDDACHPSLVAVS